MHFFGSLNAFVCIYCQCASDHFITCQCRISEATIAIFFAYIYSALSYCCFSFWQMLEKNFHLPLSSILCEILYSAFVNICKTVFTFFECFILTSKPFLFVSSYSLWFYLQIWLRVLRNWKNVSFILMKWFPMMTLHFSLSLISNWVENSPHILTIYTWSNC